MCGEKIMDNVRILVIDDEEDIRETLKAILENEGYIVDMAKNGEEAIEKAHRFSFNLALIDIRLPDIDGTELLTVMRESTPKMVKIIVTGYPVLENAVDAVNKGADGYIIKPFVAKDLLNSIKEHLQKQKKEMKFDINRIEKFIESRAREINSQTL